MGKSTTNGHVPSFFVGLPEGLSPRSPNLHRGVAAAVEDLTGVKLLDGHADLERWRQSWGGP